VVRASTRADGNTGGGYVLSCGLGHFAWFYNITKSLAKAHSVTSIVLSYTCAPEGQYPTQLKQAAELLKHLIEVEGRKPSDVCAHDLLLGLSPLTMTDHNRWRFRGRQSDSRIAVSHFASSSAGPKQDQAARAFARCCAYKPVAEFRHRLS